MQFAVDDKLNGFSNTNLNELMQIVSWNINNKSPLLMVPCPVLPIAMYAFTKDDSGGQTRKKMIEFKFKEAVGIYQNV